MLWNRSLVLRLVAPYLVVLVAVTASLYLFTDRVLDEVYADTISDMTLRQARLVAEILPWGVDGKELDRSSAELDAKVGARVTVVAPDGTVLGDSAVPSAALENHASRPEIRDALRTGEGTAVRVSASTGEALFYRAWRQRRDGRVRVVRLAVSMASVRGTQWKVRTVIGSAVAVGALAALWPTLMLAYRLSGRIGRLGEYSKAVGRGEHPPPLAPGEQDALGHLEMNLDHLAVSLSRQVHSANEERRRLEAVLRGMVEGVLVLDDRGTVLLSNRVASVLFGLPPETSYVGRPLIEIVRDPDLLGLVRSVIQAEAPSEVMVREIMVPGSPPRVAQATATPIHGEGERAEAFIFVFHDITELKRLEQTRRDFVANVSHELRTPLAAIRGYGETLLSGALDDARNARRFLSIIERHAERLGRLVDDLLTLSDLELGRTELRRRAVRSEMIIENACEVLRGRANEAGVSLRQEVPSDLPPLDADPDRLVQMLLNVVDNSIKYTPKGGTISVGARQAVPTATGAPEIEIWVRDTGIGIPSEDLPRLTERFYRVDKVRSRELGGTGLGLAIVKHIVQAHGGRLQIESELGRGTAVRIFLPAIEQQDG